MSTISWFRKKADLVFAGNNGQIIKGVFNATTAGYGLKLQYSATFNRTWIERGNADDGGVAWATGQAYLFGSRRVLTTYAHTGNLSIYGGSDRLSVNSDLSGVTAHVAGHWGFLEFKGTSKVNRGAAVRGQVDLVTGATVTGVVSAFMAATNYMGGTHTGPCVILDVTRPVTGTWDGLMNLDSLSGTITACNTALSGLTATYKLPVYRDGSLAGYIPLIASIS